MAKLWVPRAGDVVVCVAWCADEHRYGSHGLSVGELGMVAFAKEASDEPPSYVKVHVERPKDPDEAEVWGTFRATPAEEAAWRLG